LIQQADRDVSTFAVGLPQIGRGEVMSRENLAGSCEVQAALGQCLVSFLRVELDFHANYCMHNKYELQAKEEGKRGQLYLNPLERKLSGLALFLALDAGHS